IQNTGTAPWDFTALLHTYLAVGAIGDVSVTGLQGVRYVDKVADGAEATETRESITVDGEVDRVYVDVKTSPSTRLAVVEKTPGRPTVSVHRSALPDVVVWNPWTEKARAMGDFDDDEYRTMIYVEAGHVATPYTLPAGETWTASQTLAV
ncbi:galactose mutarotase-like protein, partial [Caulochytrium protostelioides]